MPTRRDGPVFPAMPARGHHGSLTRTWFRAWRAMGHDKAMNSVALRPLRLLRIAGLAAAFAMLAASWLPVPVSAGSPAPLVLSKLPEPGASAWSAGMHSAVRLLDGGARPDDPGRRLAGVEIRMSEHF